MVASDFVAEMEIRPFLACAMHPAIVDLAMGQIATFDITYF